MKEFDKKTLETAIIYVKRLAEGNNPINNQPMEEDTVLNNPNVIRCMYFVKEVLEEVYSHNCKREKKVKEPSAIECFRPELLTQYRYREDKGIQSIIGQLYEPVADEGLKKIPPKVISDKLLAAGFISKVYSEEFKKNVKVPSEKGASVGMRAQRVDLPDCSYISIIYNEQAQKFLITNFMKLLRGEALY